MDNFGQQPQRPMFDLNPPVPCSKCGTQITKLPFRPDPNRTSEIKCLNCFRESKGGGNFRR